MKRLAIVLFNLGGPDQLSSVEPFLFNLFKDRAIINLPGFLRIPLAKFISWRRAPIAQEIYSNIGGHSPLLEETKAQADFLSLKLTHLADDVRVFIAMRYWHPMSKSTVEAVKSFDAEKIILLPLYPQFSTATTGSSLLDWNNSARAAGLKKTTYSVCCYPCEKGYIKGLVTLVEKAIANAKKLTLDDTKIRVLFSAHGLPKKIIASGDPYQWQIEKTSNAVVDGIKNNLEKNTKLDWTVCYQSRVGPLEWISPSLDIELVRASQDNVGVIIVPIAFVSEHSETLVELDIEYREKAEDLKIPFYIRVPTLSIQKNFIDGLVNIIETSLTSEKLLDCHAGIRQCSSQHIKCPLERV